MAKLNVTFIMDASDRAKDVIWTIDRIDKSVTLEQAEKSLKVLKRIEFLLKANGEHLYGDVQEIQAEILEEKPVLSVSKV